MGEIADSIIGDIVDPPNGDERCEICDKLIDECECGLYYDIL